MDIARDTNSLVLINIKSYMIPDYVDRIFREPILFYFIVTENIIHSRQTNLNDQNTCNRRRRVFRSEYLRCIILKYCFPTAKIFIDDDADYVSFENEK
jgi:hypothetical protein